MAIQVLPEPREPRDSLVMVVYEMVWALAIGVLLYAALTGRLL